jgi:hypothetical protein
MGGGGGGELLDAKWLKERNCLEQKGVFEIIKLKLKKKKGY